MDNVGYKKPPVATQFAKGKSGNPKGRPKGSKNLRTILTQELSEKITVHENGRSRRFTMQEVMIKQAVQKAVKGDSKALQLLLGLTMKIDPDHASAPQNLGLKDYEQEILNDFISRIKGKSYE
ncbi:MAG: hypothetical protein EBS53_00720 [Bacteroidetes bacterium]|nr:hypothetical protein [Bacteroidota bacterium]